MSDGFIREDSPDYEQPNFERRSFTRDDRSALTVSCFEDGTVTLSTRSRRCQSGFFEMLTVDEAERVAEMLTEAVAELRAWAQERRGDAEG